MGESSKKDDGLLSMLAQRRSNGAVASGKTVESGKPHPPPSPVAMLQQIELGSPAVQEILGAPPHWILRWGLVILGLVIVLIGVGSWVVRYPELVPARISVTTLRPPVPVVSRASGELLLLVEEHAKVEKGAPLGAIENAASLEEVLVFKSALAEFNPENTVRDDRSLPVESVNPMRLGELRESFSQFLERWEIWIDFNVRVVIDHQRGTEVVEGQVSRLDELRKQLQQRKALVERQVQIATEKHEKNGRLFGKGHIAEVTLTDSERTLLQHEDSRGTIESSLLNNEIQRAEKSRALLDLQSALENQRQTYRADLRSSYRQLKNQLSTWEEKYLLVAPIDGRVCLFSYWSDSQYVRREEEVLTLVPEREREESLLGKVLLPRLGAGKVEVGQRVRVKFDRFPHGEFGMVEGRVESISLVAREDQYLLEVSFPGGLRTTFAEELAFKQEMAGDAEIVTEDLRLVERVFNRFRSIFGEKLRGSS